jgi:hypothetical protein
MSTRFSTPTGINIMKPMLGWEKWKDPYYINKDESDNYEGESSFDSDSDENSFDNEHSGKMRVVVTPMGALPLIEQSSPNKVFNLWVAHTNFSITHEIAKTVENTEGVETLDIFSRYRMRVGIGKMFNSQEIIKQINKNLSNVINNNE